MRTCFVALTIPPTGFDSRNPIGTTEPADAACQLPVSFTQTITLDALSRFVLVLALALSLTLARLGESGNHNANTTEPVLFWLHDINQRVELSSRGRGSVSLFVV